MFMDAFDRVDWPHVHRTLTKEVPRLFQVWACKQLMNIVATNKNLIQRLRNGWSNKCPCCRIHVETAEYVLLCPKECQVEVFMQSSMALERWLNKVDTDPDLADSIIKYAQQQGTVSMEDIVQEAPSRFQVLGKSQDKIGWRSFLEGMISKEITGIQQQYYALNGMQMSLEKWSSGLITRLLEIMHG
jgi:hypothetical protein